MKVFVDTNDNVENRNQFSHLTTDLENIGFNVDISAILEAYGLAHGEEWLAKFYTDNEAKLHKLF